MALKVTSWTPVGDFKPACWTLCSCTIIETLIEGISFRRLATCDGLRLNAGFSFNLSHISVQALNRLLRTESHLVTVCH